MSCNLCNHTGYLVIEIPVFADGGYSDVQQVEGRCRCNPEPTDEDAPEVWYEHASWFPADEDDLPEYDDNWVPGTAWEDFQPHAPVSLYGTE